MRTNRVHVAGPGAHSGDRSKPRRAPLTSAEVPVSQISSHPPIRQLQPVRITGSSDVDAELTTRAEQRPQPRHPDVFMAQVPAGEPLTGGQGDPIPPSVSWRSKVLEPADSDTDGA